MYWTQGNHLPTGCIPNEAVHCCVCTHCTERLSTVVYVQWGCPLLFMYSEAVHCCVCTVRLSSVVYVQWGCPLLCTVRLSTVVYSQAGHCCVQSGCPLLCTVQWGCPLLCTVQWGCPLLCTVRLSTVVYSKTVHCCVQFWNCVYCAAPWICGRMARELFFNYCVPHQHHDGDGLRWLYGPPSWTGQAWQGSLHAKILETLKI